MKFNRSQCAGVAGSLFVFFGFTQPAFAHVKWFSDIDWATAPRTVSEITTPTFWSMFALTLVTLVAAIALDEWANKSRPLQSITKWFASRANYSLLVVRVAAFATLLVAWQQGTLLTPETELANPWIERLQFVTIVLLLFPRTTTLAGLLFLTIWTYGAVQFGIFHMLDYVNAVGVGYFLLVRPMTNKTLRATALPVLYSTVGFSLIWLGCEKLVYPQWALYLLEQNPLLTLGLPAEFFLTAAAFVEIGLGFLLIICLFSRSLSITITLVFFLTTCVFGKVEIIGHTLIHASLIVFLLEGAGHSFTPPSMFHKTRFMRMAFATVNFSIALFVLLNAYLFLAPQAQAGDTHVHPQYPVAADDAPTIELEIFPDNKSGFNVHLITSRFEFTPAAAGESPVPGTGHVHLFLDGRKIARVYSDWYHLVVNSPGEHTIRATLNTNDHADFSVDGKVIAAEKTIQVTDELTGLNCHAPK